MGKKVESIQSTQAVLLDCITAGLSPDKAKSDDAKKLCVVLANEFPAECFQYNFSDLADGVLHIETAPGISDDMYEGAGGITRAAPPAIGPESVYEISGRGKEEAIRVHFYGGTNDDNNTLAQRIASAVGRKRVRKVS